MPQFEWDPEKARSNRAKHGMAFEIATRVWDDPLCVIIPDGFNGKEERWLAIGTAGPITILIVVHTYPATDREDIVRIISARKATPHERRRYERESI